jgi:NhaP-type Na+/H+ or K+/H+ antiporter
VEQIILSLAIVMLLGVLCIKCFSKLGVPAFLGFLLIGILLGPYATNILNIEFMGLTQEIATMAMVILLIRAGLGLSRDSLRKVGRVAVEMSCIPSVFEGLLVMIVGHYFLGISFIESGMLGFILAAVSPAILVPRMLNLIDKGLGTKKGIPEILLTGSSADDVVAITIFSVFLGMYTGGNINIVWSIASIPISLILGVLTGFVTGLILLYAFRRWDFSDIEKLLVTLATGILLNSLGEALQGRIPLAGLVGVMVIGFLLLDRMPKVALSLSNRYSNLWIAAEIIIFVLLGAQLELPLLIETPEGLFAPVIIVGIFVICMGLIARFGGVFMALAGSGLNNKEKVFCMTSYIPKANVQATIGAVPLAAGVASGELILAISAISIIFTAPLGALLIDFFNDKLLSKDEDIDNSKSIEVPTN